jgi:hypothetical protein
MRELPQARVSFDSPKKSDRELAQQRSPVSGQRFVATVAKGYLLDYSEFNGNHSYVGWRTDLARQLVKLAPYRSGQPGL